MLTHRGLSALGVRGRAGGVRGRSSRRGDSGEKWADGGGARLARRVGWSRVYRFGVVARTCTSVVVRRRRRCIVWCRVASGCCGTSCVRRSRRSGCRRRRRGWCPPSGITKRVGSRSADSRKSSCSILHPLLATVTPEPSFHCAGFRPQKSHERCNNARLLRDGFPFGDDFRRTRRAPPAFLFRR